jgi:hypothetical protein
MPVTELGFAHDVRTAKPFARPLDGIGDKGLLELDGCLIPGSPTDTMSAWPAA